MSLEYDVSWHLHCRLTLNSGRSVSLESLHQWMTYAGWLEGVPSPMCNDRIVEGDVREAGRYCVQGSRPHLIPPLRRDYLREPGDMTGTRALGGEAAEWLPVVTCVGVFKGAFPARDKAMDQSFLTVVWHQDEYAPPITGPVLDHIRSLDWETLATDVEI